MIDEFFTMSISANILIPHELWMNEIVIFPENMQNRVKKGFLTKITKI